MQAGNDPIPHRCYQGVPGLEGVGRGRDWGAELHNDRAGSDAQAALRQDLAPAPNGDRDDGHPRLERQDEPPLLEREKSPVGAPRPLGEDHHGHAAPDDPHGAIEAPDGLLAVSAIDEDESAQPQGPAEDRHMKKPALGDHTEWRRHGQRQGWDIELALMVGHINVRLRRIELGVVDRVISDPAGLQTQPGPQAGDGDQGGPAGHEEADDDSDGPQDDRVKDDEARANQDQEFPPRTSTR